MSFSYSSREEDRNLLSLYSMLSRLSDHLKHYNTANNYSSDEL